MGQRARNSGLLSRWDSPELAGLAAYMQGRRWLRDGEGHGDGGGSDDPGDDDAPDDDAEEDDDSEGDDAPKDDDEDDDDKPHYSKREYDKLVRRLKASDKKQGDLTRQLNELKAGGTDKLDKAVKAEIDELKPKVSKLAEENAKLRLQHAFLTTTVKGVEWQDVDAAMRLVDLSDVDIDPETGAIDKRDLAAAMRRLAKDKPYLVKTKSSSNDEEDTDRPSGRPVNGKRKGQKQQPDREALKKKFPVLGQLR